MTLPYYARGPRRFAGFRVPFPFRGFVSALNPPTGLEAAASSRTMDRRAHLRKLLTPLVRLRRGATLALHEHRRGKLKQFDRRRCWRPRSLKTCSPRWKRFKALRGNLSRQEKRQDDESTFEGRVYVLRAGLNLLRESPDTARLFIPSATGGLICPYEWSDSALSKLYTSPYGAVFAILMEGAGTCLLK